MLVVPPVDPELSGLPEEERNPGRLCVLQDTGYAVLRSGLGATDTYVVFDGGDLGPEHCPGHGHADALSFELWANGEPLIVDPGTYQYAAGPWREYFRNTAAHNTARIDDTDQSDFLGAFRVGHLAHGRLVRASLDQGPTVVAEHDGYARLADPVSHRREITMQDAHQIVIRDAFTGKEHHKVNLYFHLAPARVELTGAASAVAAFAGGTQVRITVSSPAATKLAVAEGWLSRGWYEKRAAPVFVGTTSARLPLAITTRVEIIS